MAEEQKNNEDANDQETEETIGLEEIAEGGSSGLLAGKKKWIMLGGAILLLVIAGAGLFFSGVLGGASHDDSEQHMEDGHQGASTDEMELDHPASATSNLPEPIFYELAEFLIDLNSSGRDVRFLKMNVLLVLSDPETVIAIEKQLPIIRDTFQTYLRDLRSEDLKGSGGIYRLREELLLRINKIMYPAHVDNILFKDILVQ